MTTPTKTYKPRSKHAALKATRDLLTRRGGWPR